MALHSISPLRSHNNIYYISTQVKNFSGHFIPSHHWVPILHSVIIMASLTKLYSPWWGKQRQICSLMKASEKYIYLCSFQSYVFSLSCYLIMYVHSRNFCFVCDYFENILHLHKSLVISRSSSEHHITRAHFSLSLWFIKFLIKTAGYKRTCESYFFCMSVSISKQLRYAHPHNLITCLNHICVVFPRKYKSKTFNELWHFQN